MGEKEKEMLMVPLGLLRGMGSSMYRLLPLRIVLCFIH